MKSMTQSNLGRKGFNLTLYPSCKDVRAGTQGRQWEARAETEAPEKTLSDKVLLT